MKTVLSKINLTALAIFLLVLSGFTSCKKDDDNNSNLRAAIVGDWEVTSFTIDGVEVMGTVILASKMEFEAYTGSNGDFEWSINYGDGSSENQSGDYEVDEEDKEVELRSNDGEILKLDLDVDGDDLELSGNLDGERVVIKADRD